jgi:hypothetical protein
MILNSLFAMRDAVALLWAHQDENKMFERERGLADRDVRWQVHTMWRLPVSVSSVE